MRKINVVQEEQSVAFGLLNSYADRGISISEMEKRASSTKGDGRGLGLANVNDILRQYTN